MWNFQKLPKNKAEHYKAMLDDEVGGKVVEIVNDVLQQWVYFLF